MAGRLKRCVSCGRTKPLEEFHRHSGYSDGRRPTCKSCRKAAERECYWCGEPATGRDHVFGRMLFEEVPSDVITVPACVSHNNALQKDEHYARIYLLSIAYPKDVARRLWEGKVRRELRRSPKLRAMFSAQLRDFTMYSPGGIYLGDASGLDPDGTRISRVMEKIVRGLTYHHHLRRFGDIAIEGQLIQAHTRTSLPDLSHIPFEPERSLGEVVTYTYAIAHDDPDYSLWVFRFYEGAVLVVGTQKRDELAPPQSSQGQT